MLFITLIKKHWSLLLLAIVIALGTYAFRKKDQKFADDYAKLQAIHVEKEKRIEDAHLIERKKLEENAKLLQEKLDAVDQKYDKKESEHEEKKKTEVKKIVKEHSGKPDEVAKMLAEAAGLTVLEAN